MKTASPKQTFMHFLNLTILAAYFHAFMEWVFFATTPSTLSTLGTIEKIKILFITAGVIAFLLIVLLLLLMPFAKRWHTLGFIPATLMLSITALIMLDNFTYTLFKIGIVSTFGAWRIIYVAIFILIFYWMLRFSQRQTLWKSASTLTLSLFALSCGLILITYFSRDTAFINSEIDSSQSSNQRPNILILGSDGLTVNYLSVYGFKEDTTPFLNELAKFSLVAENAFPNASSTTASTTSALTGKAPIEVNVFRYPDILTGDDSFEHLPGILKDAGYLTVEIGTPTYVDARKINLIDGFDIVNGQSIAQPILDAIRSVLGNSPSTYFIQLLSQRVTERLFHIFFIRDMDNSFQQVNNPNTRRTDDERVQQIINLLETSQEPVFVFSHFMNTHGPHFFTDGKKPSGETAPEAEWDLERYKEAIRSFDQNIKEIYQYLDESGKLDNTIIVIYTDHGYRYTVNRRTPLIMHFPKDEYYGVRENNVQVIDIPVTLLDYLDITNPSWMTGTSILIDETPQIREIISFVAGSPKKINPPFYQIKTVQIIVCNKWYTLNVQEDILKSGLISEHTAKCDPTLFPSEEEIRKKILDYLEKYHYDVSGLR